MFLKHFLFLIGIPVVILYEYVSKQQLICVEDWTKKMD